MRRSWRRGVFRIENYDILWNGMYTVLTGWVDFVQCPSSFSGYNFGGSPAVIFLCHLSALTDFSYVPLEFVHGIPSVPSFVTVARGNYTEMPLRR